MNINLRKYNSPRNNIYLLNKMSTISHPKYNAEWTIYDTANFSTAKQKFTFPKSNRF